MHKTWHNISRRCLKCKLHASSLCKSCLLSSSLPLPFLSFLQLKRRINTSWPQQVVAVCAPSRQVHPGNLQPRPSERPRLSVVPRRRAHLRTPQASRDQTAPRVSVGSCLIISAVVACLPDRLTHDPADKELQTLEASRQHMVAHGGGSTKNIARLARLHRTPPAEICGLLWASWQTAATRRVGQRPKSVGKAMPWGNVSAPVEAFTVSSRRLGEVMAPRFCASLRKLLSMV